MRVDFNAKSQVANFRGFMINPNIIKSKSKLEELQKFKCNIFDAVDTKCPTYEFPKYFAKYSDADKKIYLKKCLESSDKIAKLGNSANNIDIIVEDMFINSPNNNYATNHNDYFHSYGETLNYKVSIPALNILNALRPCFNMFVDKNAKKIVTTPIKIEENPAVAFKMLISGNLYDIAVASPHNKKCIQESKY